MRRRRQNGFTLVEVLVASTIFVTVMIMVYTIFSSIEGQIGKAETEQKRLRVTAFLVRELSSNLAAAYLYMSPQGPAATGSVFASEDRDIDGIPADSLQFVSLAPPLGGAGATGGPKLVTIGMEAPPEDELERLDIDGDTEPTYLNLRAQQMLSIGVEDLKYRQDDDPYDDGESDALDELFADSSMGIKWTADEGMFDDGNDDRVAMSIFDTEPVWSMEVMAFNLRFHDGTDWVDQWNSAETGMLPWAVKVQINWPPDEDEEDDYRNFFLADEDDDDEWDFVAVVTLPAGYGLMPSDMAYMMEFLNRGVPGTGGRAGQPRPGTRSSMRGTSLYAGRLPTSARVPAQRRTGSPIPQIRSGGG